MSQKDSLITTEGEPRFGLFKSPIKRINYLDYDYRDFMDKPLGMIRKRLKFNQFQFIGLLSPDLVIGCAIVDLKLVSNAFIYIYHPPSGTLKETSVVHPLRMKTRFPLTPDEGVTEFRSKKINVRITGSSKPRERHIEVKLASGEQLKATLSEMKPRFEPLSLCTRAGYNGWVYTQKAAGLTVEGTFEWEQGKVDLAKINTMGSYDWSAGFMRRDTFWNWGCFAGKLPDGRSVGLNVAAGVNETGFTENVFWLDGKQIKLDMVNFEFDRYDLKGEWKLQSFDKKLDLLFKPEGCRSEKINAGIIATNFRQRFGTFYGTIRTDSKNKAERPLRRTDPIEIDGLYGFVEDHFARW